jgi:hypothetical protein
LTRFVAFRARSELKIRRACSARRALRVPCIQREKLWMFSK